MDDNRPASPPLPEDGSDSQRPQERLRHATDRSALAAFFDNHGTLRRLGRGRVLSDRKGSDLHLALVKSGTLIAGIDLPNHRRQVLFIYCPGDVIFADSFMSNSSVRLRSLSDVQLSVMSDSALLSARESAPATIQALLQAAADHLAGLMLHSASLGRLRTEERVATFFLELAIRLGNAHHSTATIDFDMRREDIADYLGLNPDTLSRSLSKLRREKVVTFVNSGRVVANLDALCERTPLAASMRSRRGQGVR